MTPFSLVVSGEAMASSEKVPCGCKKEELCQISFHVESLLNQHQAMLKGMGNIGKKLHASPTERRMGTGK